MENRQYGNLSHWIGEQAPHQNRAKDQFFRKIKSFTGRIKLHRAKAKLAAAPKPPCKIRRQQQLMAGEIG